MRVAPTTSPRYPYRPQQAPLVPALLAPPTPEPMTRSDLCTRSTGSTPRGGATPIAETKRLNRPLRSNSWDSSQHSSHTPPGATQLNDQDFHLAERKELLRSLGIDLEILSPQSSGTTAPAQRMSGPSGPSEHLDPSREHLDPFFGGFTSDLPRTSEAKIVPPRNSEAKLVIPPRTGGETNIKIDLPVLVGPGSRPSPLSIRRRLATSHTNTESPPSVTGIMLAIPADPDGVVQIHLTPTPRQPDSPRLFLQSGLYNSTSHQNLPSLNTTNNTTSPTTSPSQQNFPRGALVSSSPRGTKLDVVSVSPFGRLVPSQFPRSPRISPTPTIETKGGPRDPGIGAAVEGTLGVGDVEIG
eukprot:g30020.t1